MIICNYLVGLEKFMTIDISREFPEWALKSQEMKMSRFDFL